MTEVFSTLTLLVLSATMLHAAPADFFGIRVVDESTGKGVPLITLKTTNHLTFITDSAGWIAFQEPGMMDQEVFFHLSGPGYAIAKDGFGYAGLRLKPKAGELAEVRVMRLNIAERFYRITGQGIYRDSTLLGQESMLPRANVNAGVTGQDSVQAVPWQGRLFWLWGDTNRLSYPLGNFHSTCAWSDLPESGGLHPREGIHLEYLTDEEGQLKKMVPSDQPGVVWLFGLLTVPDLAGRQHLLGHYGRYKDLTTRVEHGVVEYDGSKGHFVPLLQLGEEFTWQHPVGNAVLVKNEEGDFYYFTHHFAVTRVPADYDSVQNPGAYEALAWMESAQDYRWQKQLVPVTQLSETQMIREKKMPAEKARFQVKDGVSGKPVLIHRSSVNWNAHRQRWIMIATQQGGEVSALGEVWYAEAIAPSGPWNKAVKIATHPRYSFYNPRHHVFFDQDGGRVIYFEGTYTETFSGNPEPTPRYDYNQLMYRLDLSDERLKMAQ